MPAARYTPELTELICDRLTEGESLRAICAEPEMPGLRTILDWLEDDDKAEFRIKYARAREAQADLMDAKILEVADASKSETAASDRVKIDAYKWRAEKLKPKVYGTKTTTELTGPDGKDLAFTDHEAAARLAAILEAVRQRGEKS